ncbi:glycerophosphodiester phosphodiesterase [Desulfobotulus mexicanus]|uniref:Glycerophosphodiester phosphodiesterase n=1 Tax=Desulfobotulus mexicanus TaxID=2586642 RepID=A0A5S5MCB0_9BACT|nr:glycerophosphodiester phosphodiesterase family protein [Desulfobotulus mexicanus]TYT73368.1 glycerophosphodiester phosphodiesterase [Desulfobotulus mexicanus]
MSSFKSSAVPIPDSPLVIAHRGYRAVFPENTLPAFQAAWQAGARMAELDVQWSRDGRLMVHHDTTLDRCSNGSGLLKDHDADFLKALDAGSWFSDKFAGISIPFLREVVATVPEGCWLNVEVKPEAVPDSRHMAKMVASLISACAPLKGRLIVSSFNHLFLQHLSRLPLPPLIGVLSQKWQKDEEILELCIKTGAFSWHPDHRTLEKKAVQRMKSEGFSVYPYTVNDKKRAEELLSMGVDGFFSDHVRILASTSRQGK